MIDGIQPIAAAAGIEVRMLDSDEQVELVNRSGSTVFVRGYKGEPYARIEPEGPVYLNRLSPSVPLSNDRLGRTRPTGKEDATASPEWIRVGDDGKWSWFDRRSHYRGESVPAAVVDTSRRKALRNYRIPIRVGESPAWIEGTLYWAGKKEFPTAILLVLLLGTGFCGLFGAWAVKRMRADPAAGEPPLEQ